MDHQTKSVRDLVTRLFGSADNVAGREYVTLCHNWQSLVGLDIAAHSEPLDVKRNALVVGVDHPGWMQLLQMREQELLERLRSEYPELAISSLQMKLQTGQMKLQSGRESSRETETVQRSKSGRMPRGKPQYNPSPGLDSIDDEELRERIKRLGRMIAERDAAHGGNQES